ARREVAGVAVIAPPYFQVGERALLEHFSAAARACDPVPFYVYEFARASGYAVPPPVIERLRERAPNLAGMKVSDAPWEAFEPYLLEGFDVFVGPESLIAQGLEHGSVGSGATGKAMGGVRQQFSTAAEVRLAQASIDFFRELGSPFFHQVGYLFLATSDDGLDRLSERAELQRRLGVPVEDVDVAEV